MTTLLTILVALAMLATVGVLFAGILGMAGGKANPRTSNWLMRWRIIFQFIAVALGISAYGLICALAVRPGVWPGRV